MTQPDRVLDLHRRASEWYEQNGLMAEAVGHALAAEDFERTARLIKQTAWPIPYPTPNPTLNPTLGG